MDVCGGGGDGGRLGFKMRRGETKDQGLGGKLLAFCGSV